MLNYLNPEFRDWNHQQGLHLFPALQAHEVMLQKDLENLFSVSTDTVSLNVKMKCLFALCPKLDCIFWKKENRASVLQDQKPD